MKSITLNLDKSVPYHLTTYRSGVRVPEGPHETPSINRGVFSIQEYSDIIKYSAIWDTNSWDTLEKNQR